jgi:hypothetical protein
MTETIEKPLKEIETNEIEAFLKAKNPKFSELFNNEKFTKPFETLKENEIDGEGLLSLNFDILNKLGFLIGHSLLILSTVEGEKKPKKKIDLSKTKELLEKLKKEHFAWMDFNDTQICFLLELESKDLAEGIGIPLNHAKNLKEHLTNELNRRKWIIESTMALNSNKLF